LLSFLLFSSSFSSLNLLDRLYVKIRNKTEEI
jgi:hypothetical protein